jgi:predicted HicB family RNase H-like nuclease
VELRPFVEGLQADLEEIAAVGDDSVADAARRLTAAVGASAGLRLLDALGEAALVEVRVSGQDPALVYVEDKAEEAPPATTGDVELVARISLRLPEALKAAVEAAAAREGVSVNTWLVRSLTRLVSSGGGGGRRGPGNRLTGFGRS